MLATVVSSQNPRQCHDLSFRWASLIYHRDSYQTSNIHLLSGDTGQGTFDVETRPPEPLRVTSLLHYTPPSIRIRASAHTGHGCQPLFWPGSTSLISCCGHGGLEILGVNVLVQLVGPGGATAVWQQRYQPAGSDLHPYVCCVGSHIRILRPLWAAGPWPAGIQCYHVRTLP